MKLLIMATNNSQLILCDNWGFYVDIENLPPKYNDNYTKMKEKYKIKNNKFHSDFETIYENLEYNNEVKYPQKILYFNYKIKNINIVNNQNNINIINNPDNNNNTNSVKTRNKIYCILYCVVATSLLIVFVLL